MKEELEILSQKWKNWTQKDFLCWLRLVEKGKFAKYVKNFEKLFTQDDDDDEGDSSSSEDETDRKEQNEVERIF